MILSIIVTVACLLAALGCLASMGHETRPVLRVARKITGITLFAAAFYIAHSLWTLGYADRALCYFLGLFALAQLLFAMHAVLDESFVERLMRPKGKPGHASHA